VGRWVLMGEYRSHHRPTHGLSDKIHHQVRTNSEVLAYHALAARQPATTTILRLISQHFLRRSDIGSRGRDFFFSFVNSTYSIS
jgi:hypothetical protein